MNLQHEAICRFSGSERRTDAASNSGRDAFWAYAAVAIARMIRQLRNVKLMKHS